MKVKFNEDLWDFSTYLTPGKEYTVTKRYRPVDGLFEIVNDRGCAIVVSTSSCAHLGFGAGWEVVDED